MRTQYAKTRKGGISGIVANDKAHTITFHLTSPDGTFLDYMAVPFAFAMPEGHARQGRLDDRRSGASRPGRT